MSSGEDMARHSLRCQPVFRMRAAPEAKLTRTVRLLMESLAESQPTSALSIGAGNSMFLSTTSPLMGGLMLRLHASRPPELLLPNPFGSGVLVSPPGRVDDLGFSPSAFDRIVIRRLAAIPRPGPRDVREAVRATALSGFAGREAQVLALRIADLTEKRERAIRQKIRRLLAGRTFHVDLPDWFAGVLLQTGIYCPDLLTAPLPPDDDAVVRLDEGPSIAPRLALMRDVIGFLPKFLPEDYNGLGATRVVRAARGALAKLETFYARVSALLASPTRLAALDPTTGLFCQELSVLPGWVRFCLVARDALGAASRAHALADLGSLAQILSHGQGASSDATALAGITRPGLSEWPPEIDPTVYLMERNERMLRAEIALDARTG